MAVHDHIASEAAAISLAVSHGKLYLTPVTHRETAEQRVLIVVAGEQIIGAMQEVYPIGILFADPAEAEEYRPMGGGQLPVKI